MKLNFDEIRTLKFALEAANSEISNRISAIDPHFLCMSTNASEPCSGSTVALSFL